MMTGTFYLLFLTGLFSLSPLSQATAEWTDWMDTDTPAGQGDYENVASITKRGYYICDNKPSMSQCRVSGDNEIFSEQTYYLNNHLIVPCSDEGLVCINTEQEIGNPCHNYEVRFFCEEKDEFGADEASVIGLAAGVSVLLPILCVVSVHIYKHRCRQMQPRPRPEEPHTTHEVRAAADSDAPPSYETLFADGALTNYGSRETLLDIAESSVHTSNIAHTGNINNALSVSESNSTENRVNDPSNIPTTNANNPIFHTTSNINMPNIDRINSRLRLPGMHLSIFDLFYHDDQQVTPPPTYAEAIVYVQEKC